MSRLIFLMMQYLALFVVTLGYWIEMAEELEADGTIARAGKGALVLLKLLVFPR